MHLDCGIQESRPDMIEMIDEAITYIVEVDSKRAPQYKLSCIVKCAKQIFSVLLESKARSLMLDSESSASSVTNSADYFLPALIYVVLKANPTRLYSNISYISRFCNPKRLMTGEGGYYFTNLCCAVGFIERIEASSLNLSEEEFERYMSGEVLPPGGGWEGGVWLCEGMRLLRQNTKALHDLSQREEKLFTHAVELKQEMLLFQGGDGIVLGNLDGCGYVSGREDGERVGETGVQEVDSHKDREVVRTNVFSNGAIMYEGKDGGVSKSQVKSVWWRVRACEGGVSRVGATDQGVVGVVQEGGD
ncbi:unnamed protein product [Darwinula stevensoni]|uniref:VPS9 domain-containing protein n=1 Tax=Darwinula stevensoni TaxID=69355 RepID=A0A7R9AF82_9CRUS|nr:unnamed protein product [Darwinula stevensoni]CAG0902717.1 unnamed protein product [Darwinula stevensoni]